MKPLFSCSSRSLIFIILILKDKVCQTRRNQQVSDILIHLTQIEVPLICYTPTGYEQRGRYQAKQKEERMQNEIETLNCLVIDASSRVQYF